MSLQNTAKQQAIEFLNNGRPLDAKALIQQLIERDPADAQAWRMLCALNGQLGLMEEAEKACRKALDIDPQSAEARCDLGNVLYQKGELHEALASYRESLRIKADSPMVLHNLGNIFSSLHRFEEAQESYEAALRLQPNALTYYNLGNLLLSAQRPGEAVDNFLLALRLNPNFAEAYNNLGNAFRNLGRKDDAEQSYRQALTLRPQNANALTNLGVILMEKAQYDEALRHFRQALELDPAHLQAAVGEARIFEKQDKLDQACARLTPILESGSKIPEVALLFGALCKHMRRCDDAVAMMEDILASDFSTISIYQRILLHFELGRLLDARGEYDRAFAHFERGNTLKANDFDPEAHGRYLEGIMRIYDKDFIATAPRATIRSTRPIFIVGVPRSGTSLVEQILASHPQVCGGGELEEILQIVDDLPAVLGTDAPYPQCAPALTVDVCDRLSHRYLEKIEAISHGAPHVTDKMPANFKHLGLIAQLFPEARIIHCVRDPLDTCLSCYFQHFSPSITYANDLGHLGAYYRQYQRLMRHWEEVLDIPMLKVDYETLIADQERISRAMVEFCGLPWDDRCLRFHETQRVVATASYDQVRRPLYAHSVNRWKNYEKHLAPLRLALNRY
jgi:tetratricopeptide (TPR) repeat protein